MKHLKSTLAHLRALLGRSLSTKYIAETLCSFDEHHDRASILEIMRQKDFDAVGIKRRGRVIGFVERKRLEVKGVADCEGRLPSPAAWRSPSTSSFVAGTSQTIQFSSAFPTSIQAGCTAFDSAGASNASAVTVQIIAGAATCVDVNYAILDRDNGYASIPLFSGNFGQYFAVATGQDLAFVASGTGLSSLDWTFGDGGTGSGNPVWHTYQTAGTFTATVTANSNAACSKSYMFLVAGPRPRRARSGRAT